MNQVVERNPVATWVLAIALAALASLVIVVSI